MSQSFYVQLTPSQLAKLSPAGQARYFQEMARKHPEGYPLDINEPITSVLELELVYKWWEDKADASYAKWLASQAQPEGE